MENLLQFKKRLQNSVWKHLACLYHFKWEEMQAKERIIDKANTVWIHFTNKFTLDYPKTACQLEIGENGEFTIWGWWQRELTEQEKAIKQWAKELCTKEERKRDVKTDSSMCYYREKAYYREHNAEYLQTCGETYNDKKIKATKLYTFKVID